MKEILKRYADLLVNYCLELKEGEKLYVNTTTLAEPLVREVYRATLAAGAVMEVNFEFKDQHSILLQTAQAAQLEYVSPFFRQAVETFDAYLYIRAPFSAEEEFYGDAGKSSVRQAALRAVTQTYFERIATGRFGVICVNIRH